MVENIIIAVFALMLLSASFLIGLFVGIGSVLNVADADHQRDLDSVDYDDAYCFHCETEMPVKVIDGVLCCKNCGLVHTDDYC